ncbi:MAG: hypothetical protein Q4C95_04910 [Planctomycetia bacterium]|nr:hypothetical protein [Planctomycetia bacterium]
MNSQIRQQPAWITEGNACRHFDFDSVPLPAFANISNDSLIFCTFPGFSFRDTK